MGKNNTWYGAPSREDYLHAIEEVFGCAEDHDDSAAQHLRPLDLRALTQDTHLAREAQALAYLAAIGPLPQTIRLLADAGVPFDLAEEGVPLLHYACAVGPGSDDVDVSVVEVLIRAGVSLDQRDASGKTPLHIAAIFGHAAAARALIAAGADPEARSDDGRTPAQDAREAIDRRLSGMEYDLIAGCWTSGSSGFEGYEVGAPEVVAAELESLTSGGRAETGLHALRNRAGGPPL